MMTDPIADMLTRIRNASKVGKPQVLIPFSRLKLTIAQILEREGYISEVETVRAKAGEYNEIKIALKYRDGRDGLIQSVKRISTPGRRLYIGYRDLPAFISKRGVTILSTPKGIMTNKDARKEKVGGELLCEIF
ncbi:MAG: 30S ribosomal protein S8 [bacterium]|nr:30S ribosomal protein S8 [bacterium]